MSFVVALLIVPYSYIPHIHEHASYQEQAAGDLQFRPALIVSRIEARYGLLAYFVYERVFYLTTSEYHCKSKNPGEHAVIARPRASLAIS